MRMNNINGPEKFRLELRLNQLHQLTYIPQHADWHIHYIYFTACRLAHTHIQYIYIYSIVSGLVHTHTYSYIYIYRPHHVDRNLSSVHSIARRLAYKYKYKYIYILYIYIHYIYIYIHIYIYILYIYTIYIYCTFHNMSDSIYFRCIQ